MRFQIRSASSGSWGTVLTPPFCLANARAARSRAASAPARTSSAPTAHPSSSPGAHARAHAAPPRAAVGGPYGAH